MFLLSVGTPFPEKPTSHVQESMLDCPTDLTTRGELDEGNHSPCHRGTYARCMPSQEEDGLTKKPGKSAMEKGKIEGDCRETVGDGRRSLSQT